MTEVHEARPPGLARRAVVSSMVFGFRFSGRVVGNPRLTGLWKGLPGIRPFTLTAQMAPPSFESIPLLEAPYLRRRKTLV